MADGDLGSANTLTGRGGKLSVDGALVARTTQWAVSQKLVSVSEWGDSDSGGYTCRAAGRKDGTFTCEGKYDETGAIFDQTQFDLFQPDDIVAALLYLKHPSLYYNFPRALCSEFNIAVNIDTEEVIGWTSSWGADGKFTLPA